MTRANLPAHSQARSASVHSPPAVPELSWGRHFLMCPPTYFAVTYVINPWMDCATPVDQDRAHDQWFELSRTLTIAGARVEQTAPVDGLPDMVFTANAGLVDRTRFIPAQMRHQERRGETAYFRQWFARRGYAIVDQWQDMIQEGAGDALPFNETLIGGYGQRSIRLAYSGLSKNAGISVRSLRLIDPRYYHIDIAFCPLDERSALIAPEAFDRRSRQAVAALVPNPLLLSPAETQLFCANSIVVGRTIIMPACTSRLDRLLAARGFTVTVVDVSEFIKAGGGCRCLTLPLDTVLDGTAGNAVGDVNSRVLR